MRLRFRAFVRLCRELAGFADQTGAWWMVAVAAFVLVVLALSTATSSAVPVAVYTFF